MITRSGWMGAFSNLVLSLTMPKTLLRVPMVHLKFFFKFYIFFYINETFFINGVLPCPFPLLIEMMHLFSF